MLLFSSVTRIWLVQQTVRVSEKSHPKCEIDAVMFNCGDTFHQPHTNTQERDEEPHEFTTSFRPPAVSLKHIC